jgi:hypothetical protein
MTIAMTLVHILPVLTNANRRCPAWPRISRLSTAASAKNLGVGAIKRRGTGTGMGR